MMPPTGESILKAIITAACLCFAGIASQPAAFSQETGITVRSIRVLATNAEALAKFYAQAFGMSETRRPVESATFTEIVLNSGSTPELAKASTATPIVIATRGKDMPAGAMAALILSVPDMDAAIARATAAGAKLMRPVAKSGEGLTYAFLTDPDGNQVELLLRR
jgi:predicted enzyme related to lactoylglutathione lyase